MKEMCLEVLKNMGFLTEYHEGLGYGFTYEGHNYLFMPSDNDEEFLSISLPGVVEMGDIPEEDFYKLMDKMNATLKYIKTNTLHDDMWLFYERELIGENEHISVEELTAVVRRMILRLDSALAMLRREMKKIEESDDENDDDDDDDDTRASQFSCDDDDDDSDDDENRESQFSCDDDDNSEFTEITDEQPTESTKP